MKSIYLLVVLVLLASSAYGLNSMEHNRTEAPLGARRVEVGIRPSPAPTLARPPTNAKNGANDLLMGLALLSIPVIVVCSIHSILVCGRLLCNRDNATKEPVVYSPGTSVAVDPCDACEFTSPLASQRPKSKSVSWQSPFETKARPSHRTTPARDLHFVMVATPDKVTPTRGRPFRVGLRKKPWEVNDDPIPQYRLDRLDSSPREDDVMPAQLRASSLSLDSRSVRPKLEPIGSPVAILQDNGEYDSDSPRVSLSSANSDDPEILRQLDEAMRWTQLPDDFDASLQRPTRALRSSSSLDDFRHDLHHEEKTNREDPEYITRSSEYSF